MSLLFAAQAKIVAMNTAYSAFMRLHLTGRIGDSYEPARFAYNAAFEDAGKACIEYVRSLPPVFLAAEHGQGALPEIDNGA